ncbi:MAG TPA: FtsX-like permease family protein, partial [Puia sp.]|nr:FtsX-like permease family protein [Puia sp.]
NLISKASPVGKFVRQDSTKFEIIGVAKNFVYGDMYGGSDPIIFFCSSKYLSNMYIKLKSGVDNEKSVDKIEAVMKKDNPGYPFDYKFVDDQFNELFKAEMLIGRLSRIFAILAILISCLGLFGLAAYTAERRTKEIGIRKVLGASSSRIAGLLSGDFLLLISIAAVIAFPLAWLAMHKWLQNYAYRIEIHWWIFLMAGALTIFIALITISSQAIRAALANPAKSLRTE